MAEKVMCPDCNEPLVIKAEHNYLITQNEDGSWSKSDGDVTYTCNACDTVLQREIMDILRQVDEL